MQLRSMLHYEQEGVRCFEMSTTVQLVDCPPPSLPPRPHKSTTELLFPPSPLPGPMPTHKYNRIKHSLADGMKVCQSSVLGGNFEATKLSS